MVASPLDPTGGVKAGHKMLVPMKVVNVRYEVGAKLGDGTVLPPAPQVQCAPTTVTPMERLIIALTEVGVPGKAKMADAADPNQSILAIGNTVLLFDKNHAFVGFFHERPKASLRAKARREREAAEAKKSSPIKVVSG